MKLLVVVCMAFAIFFVVLAQGDEAPLKSSAGAQNYRKSEEFSRITLVTAAATVTLGFAGWIVSVTMGRIYLIYTPTRFQRTAMILATTVPTAIVLAVQEVSAYNAMANKTRVELEEKAAKTETQTEPSTTEDPFPLPEYIPLNASTTGTSPDHYSAFMRAVRHVQAVMTVVLFATAIIFLIIIIPIGWLYLSGAFNSWL